MRCGRGNTRWEPQRRRDQRDCPPHGTTHAPPFPEGALNLPAADGDRGPGAQRRAAQVSHLLTGPAGQGWSRPADGGRSPKIQNGKKIEMKPRPDTLTPFGSPRGAEIPGKCKETEIEPAATPPPPQLGTGRQKQWEKCAALMGIRCHQGP